MRPTEAGSSKAGRRIHLLVLVGLPLAAALMLSGCGPAPAVTATPRAASGANSTPTSVSVTPGIPQTVSAGRVHMTASVSRLTLTVRVSIAGPATVYGGCVQPATLTLRTMTGAAARFATTAGLTCDAIAVIRIPAGQTRTFTETRTLPGAAGRYQLSGSIGGVTVGPLTIVDPGS